MSFFSPSAEMSAYPQFQLYQNMNIILSLLMSAGIMRSCGAQDKTKYVSVHISSGSRKGLGKSTHSPVARGHKVLLEEQWEKLVQHLDQMCEPAANTNWREN